MQNFNSFVDKKEKRGEVKKNADVVSLANTKAGEEMGIRKIGPKKYEVLVETGERYKNGRKKIKRERVNGNKTDAEQREKEIIAELKALRDLLRDLLVEQFKQPEPKKPKKSNETFKEIAERWITIKEIAVSYNTWKRYKGIIYNHLIPFFTDRAISSIGIEEIEDYYLAKKEIKLTQHKVVLDSIFCYAAKTKKIISKEHAEEIKETDCPVWDEEEIDCITDTEELAKLLCSLINSVVFLPAYIAIATGARLGEIIALKWKDVNFKQNTITIKKTNFHKRSEKKNAIRKKPTKNKNIRTLPVTGKDIELLKHFQEKQKGEPDHFVCLNSQGKPFKNNTLSSNFRARARCRGFGIGFHSLRHSVNLQIKPATV